MKNIKKIVVAIFIAFTSITSAAVKVTLDGHLNATYLSNSFPHQDSLHTNDVGYTIWPILTVKSGDLSVILAADFATVGIEDSNWVKNAFVRYDLTENWQFNVGRIPTTSIMTTMSARTLETVSFQDWGSTGVFAYGAQMVYKKDRWTTMFDIVADSDRSFQVSDNFDGIEFGLRTQYKIDDHWTVAGNLLLDYGDNDIFTAVDVAYSNGPFGWHFVGFSDLNEFVGCYTLATYKILPSLELHGGFDIRDGQNPNTVIGTRYIFDEKIDFTVDYQNRPNDGEENVLGVRLRRRF